MDVPVAAAAWLKGDVGQGNGLPGRGEGFPATGSGKILGIVPIGLAQAEHPAVCARTAPVDLRRDPEGRPGVGPPGVKGRVGQDFRHLVPSYAVFRAFSTWYWKDGSTSPLPTSRATVRMERSFEGQALPVPDLAKEHVVIELCEFGGEIPQLVPARSLLNHRYRFLSSR